MAYTKDWTITLKKEDVYFDVEKLSLSYSDTVGGDNIVGRDRMALDVSTESDLRTVQRLCSARFCALQQQLTKFVKEEITTSADNTLADEDWVLELTITTEAPDSIVKPLTKLMHDYIVSGALLDWYTQLAINGNREALQANTSDALARIKELIYFRQMP